MDKINLGKTVSDDIWNYCWHSTDNFIWQITGNYAYNQVYGPFDKSNILFPIIWTLNSSI